jgi:hypothetical protein
MKTPTEMTASEKVRDILWRYAPDRTEKLAAGAILAGTAVAAVADWLYKGKVR